MEPDCWQIVSEKELVPARSPQLEFCLAASCQSNQILKDSEKVAGRVFGAASILLLDRKIQVYLDPVLKAL